METVELILKVFPTPGTGLELLKVIQDKEKEHQLRLVDLAALQHNKPGETRIVETRHICASCVSGALMGGEIVRGP